MYIKKATGMLLRLVLMFPILLITWSCEENNNFIDFAQLEADEKALIQDFLDLNLEEWKSQSTNFIDNRDESGLIFFETIKGTGDSVQLNRQVSIRYTFYEISRDENNVPRLVHWTSNVNSIAPLTYITGDTRDVLVGLDEGIRYMRLFGKSRMIIPSSIGTQEFIPIVAEVEITAMELN